jgi:predicted transcriptional regulator of viral defense system
MKFLDFKKALNDKSFFSYTDIRKLIPNFDRRRLVEWQKAGYIIKIRNGYYSFTDRKPTEFFLYHIANQLYKPSYISLSGALSFYSLIPEGVFRFLSVSTLKTRLFSTKYGRFEYRHIKPTLFFGYRIVENEGLKIKIAEPEKAILDYCYLEKPVAQEDFMSLRLDKESLKIRLDMKKFEKYLSLYRSPVMNFRGKIFKNYLNA